MTDIKSIDTNIELEQLRNELNATRKKMAGFALQADHWLKKWEWAHSRLIHVRLLLAELRRLRHD